MNHRTRDEVITDLKLLIKSPGYIYSLCLMLFEDFHLSLEDLGTINYKERLSVKEATLILGYLIQDTIDYSYPSSFDSLINNKELTYKLLEELHNTFLSSQLEMIQTLFQNHESNSFNSPTVSKLEFFTKDRSMQEAIFYAGNGVYDFQYLEYLPLKYQLDTHWLEEHKKFNIQKIINIINSIRHIQQEKANKVNLINLRNKNSIKLIKKYIAGKNNKKKSHDVLKQIELIQFNSLFPPIPNDLEPSKFDKDTIDFYWNSFYDNLLDLFVIDFIQLSEFENIDVFFECFGVKQTEHNESFKTIGDYNIVNSKPIIQLSKDKWFLPIYYLLTEAVYESPYYWMCEDKEYTPTAFRNRGKIGEKIVYNLLEPLFGKENVYNSVKIKTSKGKIVSDIDVLCILGSNALCVQVKSKKMTLSARRGEIDNLTRDFKLAFQDAYEQGLKCRSFIESRNCIFLDENNKKLTLSQHIKDIFILCVSTENYPAITHNSFVFLEKNESDPYPLFVSIFDLELLTHYLKDPYEFMYYVRQRILLMDSFRGDEESIYLGYHLLHGLRSIHQYDKILLDTDFGKAIDQNYYPYKLGLLNELSSEKDAITNSRQNIEFEQLCNELKSNNTPGIENILFSLYDLDNTTRKRLLNFIKLTKQKTKEDKQIHHFTIPVNKQFGISFTSINSMSESYLETTTSTYADIKKYISKADSWLGFGSYPLSPNIIDCVYYNPTPWEYNEDIENACTEFLTLYRTKSIQISPARKINRNDRCPCGSGKKYKKCCGK